MTPLFSALIPVSYTHLFDYDETIEALKRVFGIFSICPAVVLEDEGLSLIHIYFHNAVMHVEDEEVEENIIVEEFQKGYMYKDYVVRHSMVKVAN